MFSHDPLIFIISFIMLFIIFLYLIGYLSFIITIWHSKRRQFYWQPEKGVIYATGSTASADFSQFVLLCVFSNPYYLFASVRPFRVRLDSFFSSARHIDQFFAPHDFRTPSCTAGLSAYPDIFMNSCPSGQKFAYSSFQTSSHGKHSFGAFTL